MKASFAAAFSMSRSRMEENPERWCRQFQVLLESDEAKSSYTRMLERVQAVQGLAPQLSDLPLGTDHQRKVTLPSDATVGMARRCFGRPLRGEVRVPGRENSTLEDSTPLWQISRDCQATLVFAAAKGNDFDERTTFGLMRSCWRMVQETWAEYRSG